MAVTLAQLAAALRLGDGVNDPSEPLAGVLNRILGASQAIIDHFSGPNTPQDIKDQAVTMLAAYEYDRPSSARGMMFARSYVNSGVASLLDPWRDARAASLSNGGGTPTVSTGSVNTAEVERIVRGLVSDWAEADNTDALPAGKIPPLSSGISESRVREIVDAEIEEHKSDADAHHDAAGSGGGGGTPVTWRWGWSTDTTITAVELAQTTISPALATFPQSTPAAGYLTFASPKTATPAAAHLGGISLTIPSASFTKVDDLTIGGVAHDVWRSTRELRLEVYRGQSWRLVFVTAGGGGDGLSESAVDARVRAGVEDWAETNDSSLIPATKLPDIPASKLPDPTSTSKGAPVAATNTQIDSETGSTLLAWSVTHVKRLIDRIIPKVVPAWARSGNTTKVPTAKVTGASDGEFLKVESGAIVGANAPTSGGTASKGTLLLSQTFTTLGGSWQLTTNSIPTTAEHKLIAVFVKLGTDRIFSAVVEVEALRNLTISAAAATASRAAPNAYELGIHGSNANTRVYVGRGTGDKFAVAAINHSSGGEIRVFSFPAGGGGGSSGPTNSQIDARVAAGVHDWAEAGNTDAIPAAKLTNAPGGSGGLTEAQVDARVAEGVEDWAEKDNTDLIPSSKIPGGGGSGSGIPYLQPIQPDPGWPVKPDHDLDWDYFFTIPDAWKEALKQTEVKRVQVSFEHCFLSLDPATKFLHSDGRGLPTTLVFADGDARPNILVPSIGQPDWILTPNFYLVDSNGNDIEGSERITSEFGTTPRHPLIGNAIIPGPVIVATGHGELWDRVNNLDVDGNPTEKIPATNQCYKVLINQSSNIDLNLYSTEDFENAVKIRVPRSATHLAGSLFRNISAELSLIVGGNWTRTQLDEVTQANVESWAHEGDESNIPRDKLSEIIQITNVGTYSIPGSNPENTLQQNDGRWKDTDIVIPQAGGQPIIFLSLVVDNQAFSQFLETSVLRGFDTHFHNETISKNEDDCYNLGYFGSDEDKIVVVGRNSSNELMVGARQTTLLPLKVTLYTLSG